MKVLIIEDDFALSELIAEKVSELGFPFESVHSGNEAINWLKENTPYIMILDYGLPDMNGKEFIASLQKIGQAIPPFLVSTGQGDQLIAVEMMKLGAKDYLVKNTVFLDLLPTVINRVVKEVENENVRMQAEEALRKSEAKYQKDFLILHSIFESPMDIVIFSLDKNYCYTSFTKLHKEIIKNIWGFDIGIGMNMLDFITYPEDRLKAKANFDRALKGEYFTLIEEYGDATLLRTFYENYYSPIKNASGTIVGLSIYVVDITERKIVEEHLRKFKNIVASTDDGIAFIDKNYNYIIVNKGYEKFSGIKADAFVGQTIADYLGKDIFNDKVKPLIDKCLQGEIVKYQSWFNFQALGNRFVEVKYFPYRNSQNEILGVVSNTRDITERKQIEEELRISEQNYRNLFNANIDGISIFIVDEKTQIPQINVANKSAAEMLGYSIEETIGKDPSYFENNVNSQMLEKRMNDFNANGFVKFETELKHKNGTIISVQIHAFIVEYNSKMAIMNIIRDITESKKIENSLIASEEKFRKAFTISPDAINITRLSDGVYVSVSNGFTEMTGYTLEESLGKSSLELKVWNREEDRQRFINELSSKGFCKNLEAQFRAKDGRIIIGLLSATIIQLNGEIHVITITRDITERKQADEALKKSEQQYRNFFEQDISGDYLSTLEGKLINCNPAFAKIFGFNSVEEVLSINTEAFYPDQNYRHEFISLLKKNKFLVDYEFNIIRKDGVLRHCVENVYGVFDDVGNLVQFQGYIYDITERKEAEEQLRINAEQFKLITEISIDGFWRIDLSTRIKEVNDVFCKMTGYTKEELLTMSISGLDANENYDDAKNHVKKIMQNGYDRFESKLKRKDGKIIDVEVSTIYFAKLQTVSAFFNNISPRKKAEKELMEQMEEINRFNMLMIGREEKMIELKKEINELLEKEGKPKKYKTNFAD